MDQDNLQKQLQDQSEPTQTGQQLVELVEAIQNVQVDTPEAKLNETSISDNNGNRIELNQDLSNSNDFEKNY